MDVWAAMGHLLTPAIIIGPTVLCLAMLFVVACIAIHLFSSHQNSGASLSRFVAFAFLIGIAGFVVGTMVGIAAFCSFASAGNLCGLGGVFGVGPLVSGACMAWYSYTWLRAHRAAA
ncbi:MAG: hypothetical protein ABIO49_12385 [Dokdonella sp.]